MSEDPHKYRYFFHGVPIRSPQGVGPMRCPVELADDFGKHIEAVGFVHVDELRRLAVDGVVDVAALPRQTRHATPAEGQQTWHNPPRWQDEADEDVPRLNLGDSSE